MSFFSIKRTKKNFPALWEEGGGYTNTGRATIICGPDGEKLRPIYIKRRGELACSKHALFVIRPEYYIIQAGHHRRDFGVTVYKIVSISDSDNEAEVERIAHFSEGEWDNEPPEFLQAAIKAAKNKATCYHCRSPYYARED